MTEDQTTPEEQEQEPQDGRIVKVTPFHMIAIGEWLSLKGRQLIAMAENAEIESRGKTQIVVPSVGEEMVQEILGVSK